LFGGVCSLSRRHNCAILLLISSIPTPLIAPPHIPNDVGSRWQLPSRHRAAASAPFLPSKATIDPVLPVSACFFLGARPQRNNCPHARCRAPFQAPRRRHALTLPPSVADDAYWRLTPLFLAFGSEMRGPPSGPPPPPRLPYVTVPGYSVARNALTAFHVREGPLHEFLAP